MSAEEHLGAQWPSHMKPSELLQYADQSKLQGAGIEYTRNLGRSIAKTGYKPSKHGGMSGDTHTYPMSLPITVVHGGDMPDNQRLWQGNHRVLGMNMAGYDKPVPVRHIESPW